MYLFAAAALLFGAVLGSFLNALTFRYNTGVSLWRAMGGRSRCMRCAHTLGALDLVPVVSYLLLRGRCSYCGSRISPQYPLVEVAAALLSLGVYMHYSQPFIYIFWLLTWMVILFLIVYDFRHLILPIEALLLLSALGFLSLFFTCSEACMFVLPQWWQFAAGFELALPLLILSLVSGGRWMGWGDGIMAIPLGWILGIVQGLSALILSFWIGAGVGVALMAGGITVRRHGVTLKSEIPFGPFLALGAAIVFFTRFDLFKLLGIG